MKKKYYSPEMEALELDEPLVLSDSSPSCGDENETTNDEACSPETINDF